MKVKARIQCIIPSCNKKYNVKEMRTRCDCGNLLDIKYEGNFSKKLCEKFYDRRNPRGNIFNESGVWRFRELINFINVDSEDYDNTVKSSFLSMVPRGGHGLMR